MSFAVSHSSLLSNPFYAALTTTLAPFALTHGVARRFSPDTIPFAAVPEPSVEAIRDLVPLLTPGEEIYLTTDPGEAIGTTEDLEVVSTLPCLQMRFEGDLSEDGDDPEVIGLASEDVDEMLALKARAFPGFFGPRAAELGSFFGIRDPKTGRLVAMGGERLAFEADREISAVCTDPEHLGRGYAARIVRTVLRRHARLGVGSILHATAANQRALSLYERLGFRVTGPLAFLKLRRL